MNNVLQIADYAAPYRGNFIESMEALNAAIKKRGAKMAYAFPPRAKTGKAYGWIKPLIDEKTPVLFLSGSILKDAMTLRKFIKENNINILHMHFTALRIKLSVFIAALFIPVKKIFHFHSHYTFSGLKKMVNKIIFNKSMLIGVQDPVTETANRAFPGKCITVKNAIAFGRLDKAEKEDQATNGFRSEISAVKLFTLGYNYKIKGVDLAVSAVSRLQAKYDVRLYIALSSNIDLVKSKITDQLGRFPDWITILPPSNNIAEYYNMSDIFISASRSEGFCYAVVEAAYCKRIIIASDIPAQKKLEVPGMLLFKAGDVDDLCEKLEYAAVHKEELLASKERDICKNSVMETYNLKEWVDRIINLYGD